MLSLWSLETKTVNKDYANWTALHEACNHGYLEIVKALIEHGADVNVRGLDGDTPLHDAAVNGHEEITIVLIQSGGNPESENDKKETPIEVAEGIFSLTTSVGHLKIHSLYSNPYFNAIFSRGDPTSFAWRNPNLQRFRATA